MNLCACFIFMITRCVCIYTQGYLCHTILSCFCFDFTIIPASQCSHHEHVLIIQQRCRFQIMIRMLSGNCGVTGSLNNRSMTGSWNSTCKSSSRFSLAFVSAYSAHKTATEYLNGSISHCKFILLILHYSSRSVCSVFLVMCAFSKISRDHLWETWQYCWEQKEVKLQS